jgi:steroid 5-alpha reductase family enzyme
MGAQIGKLAALDFGVQLACWGVASVLHTDQFYDFSGSCTYLLLMIQSLRQAKTIDTRNIVSSTMVCAWAIRLGTFLLSRVTADGGDSRFVKVIHKPMTFLIYWMMQAMWVFFNSYPTLVANLKDHRSADEKKAAAKNHDGKSLVISSPSPSLNWRDYAGWAMFVVGWGFEIIADNQKSSFKANPANKGRFITGGLWSFCRHPNYLGEILLWWGLWLSGSRTMTFTEAVLGMASPAFTTYLLTMVSGVPLLEKASDKKWGKLIEYIAYKKSTPVLIPGIW